MRGRSLAGRAAEDKLRPSRALPATHHREIPTVHGEPTHDGAACSGPDRAPLVEPGFHKKLVLPKACHPHRVPAPALDLRSRVTPDHVPPPTYLYPASKKEVRRLCVCQSLQHKSGRCLDPPIAAVCSDSAAEHLHFCLCLYPDAASRRAAPSPTTMADSSSRGGTSLAPAPTHPHQLSREPSREDVEMAEHLSQLNQAHDAHPPRTAPSSHSQHPATSPSAQTSEIYHSLDDTLPLHKNEQPEPAPSTSTPVPMPPRSVGGGNAPITGQICRYVVVLSLLPSRPPCPLVEASLEPSGPSADRVQQLRDDQDALVATVAGRRDYLQCLRPVLEGAEPVSSDKLEAQPARAARGVCPAEPGPRSGSRQRFVSRKCSRVSPSRNVRRCGPRGCRDVSGWREVQRYGRPARLQRMSRL